jgi:hypothetical protein
MQAPGRAFLEIARQPESRSLTDEECRQYFYMPACPADQDEADDSRGRIPSGRIPLR